jgi:hypothetical protein
MEGARGGERKREKKTRNPSDNMNKIGKRNKQGYQIKRGRHLTSCMSSIRLGL